VQQTETLLAYRVPDPGYLRIEGADQADFIQRQTTNDIRRLGLGRSLLTVLTSATARILDVWQLVPESDAIGVVTLPARGGSTARYLQSRIFFMDKVTLADVSSQVAQVWIAGEASIPGLSAIPAAGEITEGEIGGVPVRAIGISPALGGGALLLAEEGAGDYLADQLSAAGAHVLTPSDYEVWRVEQGLPGPQGELTGDFTPLEVALGEAVSGEKGCYTGQEIIARQITYDKITRRLFGLRLDGPVAPGDSVEVEGRSAGAITSAVESPRLGPIALAVLKRPHNQPGTPVRVINQGRPIGGATAALPFEVSSRA